MRSRYKIDPSLEQAGTESAGVPTPTDREVWDEEGGGFSKEGL